MASATAVGTAGGTPVDFRDGVRASRLRVPRSRGALGGLALVVLGAWAALVPFIGPYFDFGAEPNPGTAWTWTAGRGWLEVLPGAVAFLGGVLMVMSRNRVVLTAAGWLAAAAGAWLVVGAPLANQLSLHFLGANQTASQSTQTLEMLFYFYATGAAIVLFAGLAIGRVSVHSLRDVHAGQKRLAAEAEAERLAAEQRATEEANERRFAERRRMEEEQQRAEQERAARSQQAPEQQAPEQQATQAQPTAQDAEQGSPVPPRHDAGGTAEREYAHHGISSDSNATSGYAPYQRTDTR